MSQLMKELYHKHSDSCGCHGHHHHISKVVSTHPKIDDESFSKLINSEDELEHSLNLAFAQEEKRFFEDFNNIFVPIYMASKNLNDYIGIYIHGNDKLVDLLSKSTDSIGDSIKAITKVNKDSFAQPMANAAETGFVIGGQSALKLMEIDLQFKIVNQYAIDALKAKQDEISSKVSSNVNKRLKSEIITGLESGESADQVAKRLRQVWSKPIEVVVPDLLDESGNVIRKGYTYYLESDTWALMVARTELNAAFIAGRLQAYRDAGVVSIVRLETAPDERVCQICADADMMEVPLEQADGIVPLHPNCRCTWVPVFDSKKYETAVNNIAHIYE